MLAGVSTENLAGLSTEALVVVHNRVHAAFDANLLSSEDLKEEAFQLNFLLHQELAKRDQSQRAVREDLDAASSFFGVEKGLKADALLAMDLPDVTDIVELDTEREVRILPIKKREVQAVEQQIIFGVVMEPEEVDAHDDIIKEEEIEREAHKWLARKQLRGHMHTRVANSKLEIYESYIAPVAMTINGEKVKKGSWLMMLHVLDETMWADIKEGRLTGFSIGGFGRKRKL